MSIGQIVFSKKGRDKGLPFVVIATEQNYLYLADGKLRKIENPKKKKLMHVAKTNHIDTVLACGIESRQNVKNSDIRTAIENFVKKGG